MHIERLIKMANDISDFFAAEPDKETAINGVKLHIQRSWETRMRTAIIDYVQKDGSGLSDLAKAAVMRVQAEAK